MSKSKSLFSLLLVTLLLATIATAGSPLQQEEKKQEEKKTAEPAKPESVDPEAALQRLIEGNRRFVRNEMIHPNETLQRRLALGTTGQHPYAIILSCSDSRVPPENVFDAGLGDLFVVRVAGNIVDDAVIGSIEYASEHLGSRLVVVLGHEKCGAVQAAIGNQREAHLRYLVDAIEPAVKKVRSETTPGDTLGFTDKVVWENVFQSVARLESSEPVLRKLVREKELKVVGAVYHFDTSKIMFVK